MDDFEEASQRRRDRLRAQAVRPDCPDRSGRRAHRLEDGFRIVKQEDFQGFLTTLFERSHRTGGCSSMRPGRSSSPTWPRARSSQWTDAALEGTSPSRRGCPIAVSTIGSSDSETVMISAQGDRFPVEISVVPLPDSERPVAGSSSATSRCARASRAPSAITPRISNAWCARARASSTSCASRYRRLYDLVPVLDFELDSQNNIASANRKACLALGVKRRTASWACRSRTLAVPDRKAGPRRARSPACAVARHTPVRDAPPQRRRLRDRHRSATPRSRARPRGPRCGSSDWT